MKSECKSIGCVGVTKVENEFGRNKYFWRRK